MQEILQDSNKMKGEKQDLTMIYEYVILVLPEYQQIESGFGRLSGYSRYAFADYENMYVHNYEMMIIAYIYKWGC